jgi:cellulose synthase/poly-beta-1,6-N-acetylglucosamine synthase-like glycosyltransferase
VENLRTLGAHVLEVQFPKSTKSKALNAALAATAHQPCDIAVVLDADNATAPDFLLRTARHFLQGTQALQGRRAHKPSQSALALLDAASEEANNHILCRGARALGFSARLAGSGMAFEYGLFSATMSNIDALGGFDKALEGALVQQGVCIEYDEQAVVFDEKVSQSGDFSRQRGRWIAAQFRYCRQFLPAAAWALVRHGNVDFFHKALQMALPPRLLSPGLLAVGTLVSGLLESPAAPIWTLALVLNVAAFALALPGWLFQKQHLAVWLHLPKAFLASLTALLHVPQANRTFIVTPKRIVIIDLTGF